MKVQYLKKSFLHEGLSDKLKDGQKLKNKRRMKGTVQEH